MDVDVVLYQYLILRNFYQILQSPALILYALNTLDNIKSKPKLDTTDPSKTLIMIQDQFNDGSILVIEGRNGLVWGCNESWKNYFVEALYHTVTTFIPYNLSEKIETDKQLTVDEKCKKSEEINSFILKFNELKETKFKSMLRAELDKNPEYKNFQIEKNSGKTYDDEVKAFESGYFELNLLEKIYIFISKIRYWLASFREKTFKCNM